MGQKSDISGRIETSNGAHFALDISFLKNRCEISAKIEIYQNPGSGRMGDLAGLKELFSRILQKMSPRKIKNEMSLAKCAPLDILKRPETTLFWRIRGLKPRGHRLVGARIFEFSEILVYFPSRRKGRLVGPERCFCQNFGPIFQK